MKRKNPQDTVTQTTSQDKLGAITPPLSSQPDQAEASVALFQHMQAELNKEGFTMVFPPDFNSLFNSQTQDLALNEKTYEDLVGLVNNTFRDDAEGILGKHKNKPANYFNHQIYPENAISKSNKYEKKKTHKKRSIVIYETANKKPIAFLILKFKLDLNFSTENKKIFYAVITRMGVDKNHQKQGWGSIILSAAMLLANYEHHILKKQGSKLNGIYVFDGTENDFYHKNGFNYMEYEAPPIPDDPDYNVLNIANIDIKMVLPQQLEFIKGRFEHGLAKYVHAKTTGAQNISELLEFDESDLQAVTDPELEKITSVKESSKYFALKEQGVFSETMTKEPPGDYKTNEKLGTP